MLIGFSQGGTVALEAVKAPGIADAAPTPFGLDVEIPQRRDDPAGLGIDPK